MGKYRDAMLMEMRLKGFSPKTVKAYLENMRSFVSYYGKSPVQLGEEEIRGYLHYLFAQRGSSYSTVNIAYSALRFFYTKTLRREWNVEKIPRPHDKRRLPTLLDTSEVKRIFEAVPNLKHRTILMTIYSAGLRVSEAVHLKVGDIDSRRMQIRLDQAKGNKDRYTILSEVLLRVLRHYWRFYRPRYWLFPGRRPDQPISISAIQRVFRRAKQDAGIVKVSECPYPASQLCYPHVRAWGGCLSHPEVTGSFQYKDHPGLRSPSEPGDETAG